MVDTRMRDARGRRGIVPGLFLLALTARAAGAQTPAVEAVEVVTGTKIPVARGATLHVAAVHGEAFFSETAEEEIAVVFARDVPQDVRVVVLKTPDSVTICTVYVSTDPKKPTECLPGGGGRLLAGETKKSRVRFRIKVPAGVHVSARIEDGDLRSDKITGNLRMYANRGYVLALDAGGPGTIDAGVGLLGDVDAVIATEQKGPARRLVQLKTIGSGKVRVILPTNVAASYFVATQRPAAVHKVFGVEKVVPPILPGYLGPAGDSHIRLDVDTGIAGQFMLVPPK
jgi:hypothetical protein